MVRTAILGGGLAAALMGLGGCAALNPWGAVLSEDDPVSFPITSPVAVDVDSFNGDVIVTADPRLTVAQIILRREATHGFDRKKEAKASLAQIVGQRLVSVLQKADSVLDGKAGDLIS